MKWKASMIVIDEAWSILKQRDNMIPKRTLDLIKYCESLNQERIELLQAILEYSSIGLQRKDAYYERYYERLFSTPLRFIWMKHKMIEKSNVNKIQWQIVKAFQKKFKKYNPQNKDFKLSLERDERPNPEYHSVIVTAYLNGHSSIFFRKGKEYELLSAYHNPQGYFLSGVQAYKFKGYYRGSKCEDKACLAIEIMIRRLKAENKMLKRKYNELRKETEHFYVALKV